MRGEGESGLACREGEREAGLGCFGLKVGFGFLSFFVSFSFSNSLKSK